jgi:hypothetical protein
MSEAIALGLIVFFVVLSIVIEEPIKSYLLSRLYRALAYLGFGWEMIDWAGLVHFEDPGPAFDSYDEWNLHAVVYARNKLTGDTRYFRTGSLNHGFIKVYERMTVPARFQLYTLGGSVYRKDQYQKNSMLYKPLPNWSGVAWSDFVHVPSLFLDILFRKADPKLRMVGG